MENKKRIIKCKCCGKELKTYSKMVEKESYGYIYSVEYYNELETFICDGEGRKDFGYYFCTNCYNNMDESIRTITINEGQYFLNNVDTKKEELEKELLEEIKKLKQQYLNNIENLDERTIMVKKYIKDIKNAKDMKSIDFNHINNMEKHYPSMKLLQKYKKDLPITPLNRTTKGCIEEEGECPTCGNSTLRSHNYDITNCHRCNQTLKWN